MQADYRTFLFDHDPQYIAARSAEANLLNHALIVASNDSDILPILLDPACHIAAALINVMVPGSDAIRTIGLFRQYRPGTPVIALYDDEMPMSERDLHRLGVHSVQKKINSYSAMVEGFGQDIFQYRGAVPGRLPWTSVKMEPYYAVPAADFLTGTKAIFDVFLKLPAGKVIKIFEANEELSKKRVLGYLKNGATCFLLKKEYQQRCLLSVHTFSRYLMESPDASPVFKLTRTLNEGQFVLERIKKDGISVSTLEDGADFVDNTFKILSDLTHESEFLSKFMADIHAYEDAIASTYMAFFLAQPLGITSAELLNSIGMASMLQEIGLYTMPEVVRRKDLAQMNAVQKAQYKTHPLVGADILSKMDGVGEVVVQAVAQHHERRDATGFPQGFVKTSGGINRVAEIIGICGEYVNCLKYTALGKREIQAYMTLTVFPGFSLPVVEAFAKAYFK